MIRYKLLHNTFFLLHQIIKRSFIFSDTSSYTHHNNSHVEVLTTIKLSLLPQFLIDLYPYFFLKMFVFIYL